MNAQGIVQGHATIMQQVRNLHVDLLSPKGPVFGQWFIVIS